MNKIYTVIWSKVRQCYVVASELAKRNGKSKVKSTAGGDNGLRNVRIPSIGKTVVALTVVALLGSMFTINTVQAVVYTRVGFVSGGIADTDNDGHNSFKSILLNPNDGYYSERSYDPADLKGQLNTVIGYGSVARSIDKSTAVGSYSEVANNLFGLTKGAGLDGQATALGSNARAAEQATSIGNDTYAVGRSSIAIGTDDNKAYQNGITQYDYDNYFKDLYKAIEPVGTKYGYGTSPDASKRIYSPTLSQGHGSIAIGSR